MPKFIDADKLTTFIKEYNEKYCEGMIGWSVPAILAAIELFPAEDVEEVRHGRWIDYTDGNTYAYGKKLNKKCCSVCNSVAPYNLLGDQYFPEYCGCGAKMETGE